MDLDDFSPSIQDFKLFIDNVKTAVELDKIERNKPSQKRIGVQKGGVRTQDTMDMTKLSISSFHNSECAPAHCRHQCLVKTGLSPIEINDYNEQLKIQHRHNLRKWLSTSSSRRSAKPREGKMTSQEVTCLCCRMNCLNSLDGSGCFIWEQACRNAKT